MSFMANMAVTSTSSCQDFDHLFTLCKYISQTASRIRFGHLSNNSFSLDDIQFCRDQLLSIAENLEGSTILLESLLVGEQRQPIDISMQRSRHCYTRDELLKLRRHVSPNLSNQTKHFLESVVEHVNAQSNKASWKNIRDIIV